MPRDWACPKCGLRSASPARCPECKLDFVRDPAPIPTPPSAPKASEDKNDAGGTDLPTWVSVRNYSSFDFQELQFARATLEAAGIPYLIPDEHILTANPMLGGAIHALQLQVPSTEIEQARSVLEHGPALPQDRPKESMPDEAEPSGPRCPGCGSTDTRLQRKPGRSTWLAFLFFGLPFLFFPKKLYCFSCRNYFANKTR